MSSLKSFSPFKKPGKGKKDNENWTRRHDDHYNHDYFEEVNTGRVTWTEQKTHSNISDLTASPSSVTSKKSSTSSKVRFSPSSIVSKKSVNTATLGDDTYNPMAPDSPSKSGESSAPPTPANKKGDSKRGFLSRMTTSWRWSTDDDDSYVNRNPDKEVGVELGTIKKMATLGSSNDSFDGKKKSFDYRKDPKYLAGRWNRRMFALASSLFFVCVGIVLAYKLTEGFSSLSPFDSGPHDDLPVYSDAELNEKLQTASCSEDKEFLKGLLQGEADSAVGLSTDIILHNFAAKIEVVYDVPVVEILRGKITIESLDLTMDVLPTKISPVIDASLCGHRHFEFPFALQREAVDMREKMGVKVPITLDSGEGMLRMTTVKKSTLENFSSNRNRRKLTNGNYYIDFFTLQATALVPSSSDAIWSAPWSDGNQREIDMALDFDAVTESFRFTLLEMVSANLADLFTSSTCLTTLPTAVLDNIEIKEDSMSVYYDSLVGLKVSGPAQVSGDLKKDSSDANIEVLSPISCQDPSLRVIFDEEDSSEPTFATTRQLASIRTVKFERFSNKTEVAETKRMLVPARGAPVNIEVNEDGNGIVVDPTWSIFSRPKPYVPPFSATVTIKSQATAGSAVSTPYYVDKLTQYTRLYNDRPYKYNRFPKFMEDMTVVQPSNEDSAWPGEFDKSNMDHLFCVSTDEDTPAVYVIIDNDMLMVPDWLSSAYMRLDNAEVGSQTKSWTEWSTNFAIYWRPLNGDDEPCFGINGGQLDLMYTVAFGDTPPTSLTRVDEDCEEDDPTLCVDNTMTNDFQLRDGIVKLSYVDGKPHDMYIAGLLTIYVGYTRSVVPVKVQFHTDFSNFRFEAKGVEVTTFSSAISSVAPTDGTAPLLSSGREGTTADVASRVRADILFSTYDEDMGLRVKADTEFILSDTQITPLMKDAIFHIDSYIPFDYNHTHNYFLPGDANDFVFNLNGTAAEIVTGAGHRLTDSKLEIRAKGGVLNAVVECDMHLNFTKSLEEDTVSSHVSFSIAQLFLNETDKPATATFSGHLLLPGITPTAAPWMTMRAGGVNGVVDFSSSGFTIKTLSLYASPTFKGLSTSVSGMAKFDYQAPKTWSLEVTVYSTSEVVVKDMIGISFRDAVAEGEIEEYVGSTVIVDVDVKVNLKDRGEFFRLEVGVGGSELAPEILLGAEEVDLKMIVSASETDVKNVTDYRVFFKGEVDRLLLGEHFEVRDGSVELSADLSTAKTNPDLEVLISGKTTLKFGNASVGDLKVESVLIGRHWPYENKTEIGADISLDESGWVVNEELKVTSGLLAVEGVHENGNWTFDPVDYKAAGQYLLGGGESESERYVVCVVEGRASQETGEGVVKVASSLGGLDDSFKMILPAENYDIPAAGDVSVMEGDFEVCISSYDINDFAGMDCVDGVVIESVIVVDSFLSSFVKPFGYKAANATVGMKVSAVLPAEEEEEDVIVVETVFAGRGLSISPSVTLTKVWMKTVDFNIEVLYLFEVEVELSGSSKLVLVGDGSWGGEDTPNKATLSLATKLTDDLSLLPNFNVSKSCEVELGLVAEVDTNKTVWEAADVKWEDCGVEVFLEGGGKVETMGSGSVDVLTGEYMVDMESKFVNMVDALSALLNVSAGELLPEPLQFVEIDDTSVVKIGLNSEADTLKMGVVVDVSTVDEIKDAVEALGMNSMPDLIKASCEIETRLSKPAWNETSIKFVFAAEGFKLGGITVDTFELEVLKEEDGSLVLESSSVFMLLGQKFLLKGVTSVDEGVTALNMTAAFLEDGDNKLYLFEDKIHVTTGRLALEMAKEDSEDAELEVVKGRFDGEAMIHYTKNLYSDNSVKMLFGRNLEHYVLEVSSLSSFDLFGFVPYFPSVNYELTGRSDFNLKYTSLTKIAEVDVQSNMVSSVALDPVKPLLEDIDTMSAEGTWLLVLKTNVSESTEWWEFRGELGMSDVKIGESFEIGQGSLIVEMGSEKNSTWSFSIDSSVIVSGSMLAGKNETIVAELSGSYDSETDLLSLSGVSKEGFHPMGQQYMEMKEGSVVLDLQAPKLELVKLEMTALLTTTFTSGEMTSEFVCLKNCQDVFVRSGGITIVDLEDVFNKVTPEHDDVVSAESKNELDPVWSMELRNINITVSNFENSKYEVARGFSLDAGGKLEETDTNVESKVAGIKDNAFKAEFLMNLHVDYFVEEGERVNPSLYLIFDVDNAELIPGVDIIGFTFNCKGLMSSLDIQLSTVLSVQLPSLEAPLITTVEGDFNLALEDGEAEIDSDWTATATTTLAQSFKWNPMGVEIFKLVNPHLHLHFSEDEDTPEEDVEVDKLEISSKNITLSDAILLHKPKFTVTSFEPQEFMLETGMTIDYKEENYPLKTNVRGTFMEVDVEGDRGVASLRSEMTEAWWPLGNDMVVVAEGGELNLTFTTELGSVKQFESFGGLEISFDGENMTADFSGKSGGDLDDFCFMFRDVPVVSIGKVLGRVLLGDNATEAAENWLLGEDGGVALEVDGAVYEESGGVKKAAINIGSYNQDCGRYKPGSVKAVEGHRVGLKLEAAGGGNMIELWRLIVDKEVEKVALESEIVVPNERSAQAPLLFSMALKTESSGGEAAEAGIQVDAAKIEMKVVDEDEVVVNEIAVGVDFTVKFGDGKSLGFEASGAAQEKEAVLEEGKNSTKMYDVQLRGATTSPWEEPFGLTWLEISKGTVDVHTTSEMKWEETDLLMQLSSRFLFNASLDVDLTALVEDGGKDVILEGVLSGNNIQLLAMLGTVGGESGLEGEGSDIGKYFEGILTEERISFALATMEGRFFDFETDIVLGTGVKRGVTLTVNLLNNADGDEEKFSFGNGEMAELVGAFIGADSELDLELWVGVFEEEEGAVMESSAVPPATLAVRNRGANLVFGDGFVEIVDWEVKAGYSSVVSAYPTLEAAASMIFRPTKSDEIKVKVAGGPGYLRGEMVGIWIEPFGLTWLDIGDMALDLEFGEEEGAEEGAEKGAKTDWGWGVTKCSFKGTGVLADKFGGKFEAEMLENMEDFMVAMSLFYDFGGTGMVSIVDDVLGKDEVGEGGRRRMEERRRLGGGGTCGGSFVGVPTMGLRDGDVGRNVTFLQQLLEDTGYLNADDAGVAYQYGVLDTVTSDAVSSFTVENDVFATADGNTVNYDIWAALCEKVEEEGEVVVGGDREWLGELRMPTWLDNSLWEARYSTYDEAGDVWKKGLTVEASVNVRERGVAMQALDMVGFVKKYEDMGDFSPLMNVGVYVPLFGEDPKAVNAWVEGNDFEIYEDSVYCKKIRFDMYAGWPMTMEVNANLLLDFEDSHKMEIWGTGMVEVGEVGVQKAVIENRVKGEWKDVFGIDGLALTQVGVRVGVSVTNSMDVELGATAIYVAIQAELTIGSAVIYWVGRAGATETGLPGKELLLAASLKGDPEMGEIMGQAISFKDVAHWWVRDILKDEDGRVWGFDYNSIPDEWGLYDTYFQLSTSNVELFGRVFKPGLVFSTGLSIFGIDCSVTMAVVMKELNGEMVPDFEWHVEEGLEQAEEISRQKLINEILPEGLIDPKKLTNDQRKIKERDDDLNFAEKMFKMEGIELKNINLLSVAQGERPILVIKFRFFGVIQTLEIETMTLRELYEFDLWEKLDAFQVFTDTLFSLPDCMWDSQCYDDQKEGYCKAICDSSSPEWYGDCPKQSGTCYVDDEECFSCFGTCQFFQCWYN